MAERPLALVFGGSRGIGAACVDALLRDGFDVAYTATTATQPLAARGGGRAAGYAADVRDAGAVAVAFNNAARDFATPVRVVVANAGINVPPGPLAQFSDESFRQLVEVNIVGAFNVLREAARQVADGGAIVALTTSMVRSCRARRRPLHREQGGGRGPGALAGQGTGGAQGARQCGGARPGRHRACFAPARPTKAKARSAAMSPFNRIGTPAEVADRRGLPGFAARVVGARPGRAAQRRDGLTTR